MNKCYLIFRNTSCNQFCLNIIVNIEIPIVLRSREVTEEQLCQLVLFSFFPDTEHIPDAGVEFAVWVIGKKRIHQTLIQPQFSSVRRYLEHIIFCWVNHTGVHRRSTFRKLCHHIFLIVRRLYNNGFKLCFRNREIQLVGSFNVSNFLEHIHQFRQIKELRKPGSGTVSRTFRSQLDGSGGFPEGRRPAVKMRQILFLERIILQVSHYRIKLGHGVGYRSTCCKYYATPAGQLIHITALHEHIRRFLSFRSGQSCHIPHFCVQKEVFERMALIHIQTVNT